ncbi:unnamed protein product [Boreogadus saida]
MHGCCVLLASAFLERRAQGAAAAQGSTRTDEWKEEAFHGQPCCSYSLRRRLTSPTAAFRRTEAPPELQSTGSLSGIWYRFGYRNGAVTRMVPGRVQQVQVQQESSHQEQALLSIEYTVIALY